MPEKLCINPGEGKLDDYVIRLGILLSRRGWGTSKHHHTKEIRKALETLLLARKEDINTLIPIIAHDTTPKDFPPRLRDCIRILIEGLLREYVKTVSKYSPRMKSIITNMIVETIHRIASYPKVYEELYNSFLELSASQSKENLDGGETV